MILSNIDYQRMKDLWLFVNDCYLGTENIKNGPRHLDYLPMQSMERDELNCDKVSFKESSYHFRMKIACYENYYKPIIDDIVGIMQKNPPVIKFGIKDNSESPREVCDIEWYGNQYDDGLKGLKWRLNFNQVLFGRYGMLLDVLTDSDGGTPQFCITEYPALKILDGESIKARPDAPIKLKWVLLDESSTQFNSETKSWDIAERWRVLGINADGRYYQAIIQGGSVYNEWINFNLSCPEGENVIYPNFRGKYLNFIPFTICNVNRLGIDQWQEPPYLDVANIAVSNYMVDSWYKRALINYATPTLAVCNAARENKDVRLGGVIWPKSNGANPISVQILETSGAGMEELRNAKDSLKDALKYSSIRDLLDGAGANSSGEAIKLRTSSGTSAIAAIDNAGARALEEQLIFAAQWAGATKEEACDRISYQADTSYLGTDFQLQAVVDLLKINMQSRTLSNENIYTVLKKSFPGVLTSYEDNEYQKITEMDNMSQLPDTEEI